MFDQTFLTNSGKRRPWAYAAGLAGELLGIGVLLLLPLIYTDKLPAFGLSELKITAPRAASKPPVKIVATSQPVIRTGRTWNPTPLIAPDMTRLQKPVQLIDVPIDAPGGDVVPGALPSPDGERGGLLPTLAHVAVVGVPPRPEPVKHIEPAKAPEPPKKPVEVGGDVQAAKIVRKVIPVYPPLARQARVQGVVKLHSIIAADGTIQQLQVISGHPLLVQAAVDAVRQWLYRPTHLNGKPVEVSAPIDVNFTLSQ